MATLTPEVLSIFRQNLQLFVSFSDLEWALFSEKLYLRKLKKRELFITSKSCNCGQNGTLWPPGSGVSYLLLRRSGSFFCYPNTRRTLSAVNSTVTGFLTSILQPLPPANLILQIILTRRHK